ncbi:hypothetical protein AC579_7202 [Pseudocercospora musae]|uniref:Uncharacterized protein n=1 Tax=Pseudocercospora musae TaxID=113226 RepID=A0A139HCG0_9PEZI|nr:hypothetical protein AC579_7202 [Pseudocercospora musae]
MAHQPDTAARNAPRTLSELVQSLPRELYDQVYEETFTWKPPAINVVDGKGNFDHPATSLLRVNRATRSKMLRAFYQGTRFDFATCSSDGIRYSLYMTAMVAFPSSAWYLVHDEGPQSDIATYLHPFGVALKLKGLSSGIDLERAIQTHAYAGWLCLFKANIWGLSSMWHLKHADTPWVPATPSSLMWKEKAYSALIHSSYKVRQVLVDRRKRQESEDGSARWNLQRGA